jgi:hypothetical protein
MRAALEAVLARERRGAEAFFAAALQALLSGEGDPGLLAQGGAAALALGVRETSWPSPLGVLEARARAWGEGPVWRAGAPFWRAVGRAEQRILLLAGPEVRAWAARLAPLPPWVRLLWGTWLFWLEQEGVGVEGRRALTGANWGVLRSLRPGDRLAFPAGGVPEVGPPPF